MCEWKLHPLPCLFNVSRLMLWGFLSDPRTRFVWCHSFRTLSALWMFEFQFYSSKESVNKIKAIKELTDKRADLKPVKCKSSSKLSAKTEGCLGSARMT